QFGLPDEISVGSGGRAVQRNGGVEAANLEPLDLVVGAEGLAEYPGLIMQSLVELARPLRLDVFATEHGAGVRGIEVQALQIIYRSDDCHGAECLDRGRVRARR